MKSFAVAALVALLAVSSVSAASFDTPVDAALATPELSTLVSARGRAGQEPKGGRSMHARVCRHARSSAALLSFQKLLARLDSKLTCAVPLSPLLLQVDIVKLTGTVDTLAAWNG